MQNTAIPTPSTLRAAIRSSRLVLASIPALRRAFDASEGLRRECFDDVLRFLSDEREVELHFHDAPHTLPEADRAALLEVDGRYFVGVAMA